MAVALADAVEKEVSVDKEEDLLLQSSIRAPVHVRHFPSSRTMRFNLVMLVLVLPVVMVVSVVLAAKVVLQETPMILTPILQPQHGATMKVVLVETVVPVVMVEVPEVVQVVIVLRCMRRV